MATRLNAQEDANKKPDLEVQKYRVATQSMDFEIQAAAAAQL